MALADIVTQIATKMAPTPVLLGPTHLVEQAVPPRIVFVPTAEKFGPPGGAGREPRQVLTRIAGCSVHIWGADIGTVEALLASLLSTIDQVVARPNYLLDGQAAWQDQQGSLSNLGVEYAFHIAFKIPVTYPAAVAKVVTAIPQTAKLDTETDE